MHIHCCLPPLTPVQRQCFCSDIPTSPNTLHFLLFSLGMLAPQLPTWSSSLITYSTSPLPASHCLFSLPCFSPFYLSLPTGNTHNSISPTEHTNGISAFFPHWYIPRPKTVLGISKVCNKCWKYYFYVTLIFLKICFNL